MPAYTATAMRHFSIGGGGRLLDPIGDDRIVDDEHEGRVALGERDGARNVVRAGGLLGPKHALDAGAGHQFRLGDGRRRKAERTQSHLALGDIHALVDLHVGAHSDAGGLGVSGHLVDVLLEQVEVNHHGRRRQHVFGDVAKIAAGDASFELGIGKSAGRGFCGPRN